MGLHTHRTNSITEEDLEVLLHFKVSQNVTRCQQYYYPKYCIIPLCQVTFCVHSGIIPVGQFTRKRAKSINQAWTFIVNLYNHFGLIGLLGSYRPICFYGGGAKVTQYDGMIQYVCIPCRE